MAVDVTDQTFQQEVIDRSHSVPVIVDLWAPWCGPCQTLGPILERATDATNGQVVLAKVNVDENPQISGAFRVQSIPAVYILKDGAVVDGFVGGQPEHVIQQLVQSLLPDPADQKVQDLIAAGTEESLRDAVALAPGNEDAVCSLAEFLVRAGQSEEALQLLARLPETDRVRHVAAAARLATWAHEAIHSTGHPSRLARNLAAGFGSAAYAREELVAELGAVLLGERLAIGSDTANHAAYLRHWCELLRQDSRLLLQVLGDARRAADLIAPEPVSPAPDPGEVRSRVGC